MSAASWTIPVGDETTSAEYEPAVGAGGVVFVCAHGAGGHKADRGMLATARTLREAGIGVVRFNFAYKERKSARPDPMPKLKETCAAVAEHVRRALSPQRLIVGGRSMGGRAFSMLAADGFAADGLLLLAYPLHPAGRPDKLRDAHLPRIALPVLCLNGTRDALCTRELMDRAVAAVTCPWRMRWIEGTDHSFHVLKSSGRTDAEVMREIGDAAGEWIASLPRAQAQRSGPG